MSLKALRRRRYTSLTEISIFVAGLDPLPLVASKRYTRRTALTLARTVGGTLVKRVSLLILVTALLAPIPSALTQPQAKPDLLLLNAHIITMNPRKPSAEAVAIKDGRIAWVGSTADAKSTFGDAAETLDLGGATVLPGIIDAHAHLMSLGESFLKLDLKGIATPEEAARRVKEKAATVRSGEWILGWGWDEGKWAGNYPTHELLTEAAPTNPVFLTGLHSFAAWANKRALLVAGINKDTRDPENGKIIRDE